MGSCSCSKSFYISNW